VSVITTEACDTDSFKALEIAKKWAGYQFQRAVVTRYGLTLSTDQRELHFNCAVAGYPGTGPLITSEILELFGFGERTEIFAMISVGEDQANYTFNR
jgi:hypothetical protein